ncbi:MAG: L-serine ammonia-lyase, iron-sulfur-dependent, subunit alpha, partial [Atribacterota bacterium]|nr:L-serine ammonia-lyase, iron-sulfur-dependent, subunit alpha [Atribacterota bacterium]
EASEKIWLPKIVGNDSLKIKKYRSEGDPLSGDLISRASEIALSVATFNASMGRIVAAPTAGSCGILPGLLFSWEEHKGSPTKDIAITEGLIVAAAVGQIIANRATLSGAEGGCQAECGAAVAMGSAALVWLEFGKADPCFQAAAISLKSVMGLICDPVAGLVEVPCIKRNGTLVALAVISADMAMSGIQSAIPPDEVVDAMYKVGKALPPSLRETGRGGVAATQTGMSITAELKKNTPALES